MNFQVFFITFYSIAVGCYATGNIVLLQVSLNSQRMSHCILSQFFSFFFTYITCCSVASVLRLLTKKKGERAALRTLLRSVVNLFASLSDKITGILSIQRLLGVAKTLNLRNQVIQLAFSTFPSASQFLDIVLIIQEFAW